MNSPFSIPVVTPFVPNQLVRQDELILGLYDINQQRLVDSGSSVFIGDRLFIEIKYRTGLILGLLLKPPYYFNQFSFKLCIIMFVAKS